MRLHSFHLYIAHVLLLLLKATPAQAEGDRSAAEEGDQAAKARTHAAAGYHSKANVIRLEWCLAQVHLDAAAAEQ